MTTTAALIVAAGRGSRAAAPGTSGAPPKQYALLAGQSVLAYSIAIFTEHPAVDHVQVVIHPADRDLYDEVIGAVSGGAGAKLLAPVFGGATRQASVLAGLLALGKTKSAQLGLSDTDHVLIHDAARPFTTSDVIDRIGETLKTNPGAIAAQPVADTLKREGTDGSIEATLERDGLWLAQTPQGFRFGAILDAHRRAAAAQRNDFTDDAAVAEWAGIRVALVEGGARNVKITSAGDLAMANAVLGSRHPGSVIERPAMEIRTGTGFDVHRFTEGVGVWLCGVNVPHTARLKGHSDADVGLHALTDAILGAIGAGDIGQHFPPTDPRWKDAASHIFLAHAVQLVGQRGGRIINVDVTIMAEAPKVGPHREAMRERMAAILGIELDRVSVKATTTEGLGFTGRREGIAAMATASVAVPSRP